jgi:Cellulase (glycosyl hydrolase family 5)
VRERRLATKAFRWAVLAAVLGAVAVSGLMFVVPAVAGARTVTVFDDEVAGPPLMGLGVELDPYDSFQPTATQWNVTFQRLDFMRPGFLRVVEPASRYFAGYDAQHNPRYRWNGSHIQQLRTILDYAQSRGITVVLGDWTNATINGDARIPAEFLQQLHDVYGYTNIRYYNLINEPNDNAGCDFSCWTGIVRKLSGEFASLGLSRWLQLVGPDNAGDWDDTAAAQALDQTSGLDTDNRLGGDSWVTRTLRAIPGLIGTYDSHRYGTIWGIEHGVYGDQIRARREQISNADSPAKQYFEGEVGMSDLSVSPFTVRRVQPFWRPLAPLIEPSAHPSAGAFVDSQPHIRQFVYGAWMGDMVVQALAAGISGLSAWDLDDAMHVGGRYGSQNLKQWGFWNSLGGQDGYPASDLKLRPWFYSWSVLARSFPAGSDPLAIPNTGVYGLRMAAARVPSGGRYGLSFALVNDSPTPRSVTLRVPSESQPIDLVRYDYFAHDRPVGTGGFPASAASLGPVGLSTGVTIRLPGRGLVVLSSLGTGSTIAINNGTSMLLDNLDSFAMAGGRTKGLRLDHSKSTRFNDDHSRATVTSKPPQYLFYHPGPIASFELKAYYNGTPGLAVYRSANGSSWKPLPVESTHPAPALGGHGWFFADLLPAAAVPAGTSWLKIEISNRRTELSRVVIQHR